MKKIIMLFLLSLIPASLTFGAATVSQKQEITVTPVYSSYNLPSASYMYFDNQLISILASMKRFQVIGFQYHLDNTTVENFIQKVQDIKKQAALNNTNYMDTDLGVVVIPASEMQRLANSFFIFIPSIVGYDSSEYMVEVKEKKDNTIVVKLVKEYKARVQISVKIITTDGNLLSAYNSESEEKSRDSAIAAYQQAVNNAIGSFNMYLRNIDEFKLKSAVLEVNPGSVFLQLGKDLGVRPGYEFAIQTEETRFAGLKTKKTTGIVRVKDVNDQYSEASVIFGQPAVGDQLVETPMAGARFILSGGMASYGIDYSKIDLTYKGLFTNKTVNLNPSQYAINAGIRMEGEIGYAGLFGLGFGVLINNPIAFYGDIGGGYELYFGSISTVLGLDLSGAYSVIGLTSANLSNDQTIGNVTFDSGDSLGINLSAFSIGVKPNLSFNYQFSQHAKIRIRGGYAFFTPGSYSLSFNNGSGSDSKNSSVALSDKNVTLLVDGKSATSLPVNFSGAFGGIEMVFRF